MRPVGDVLEVHMVLKGLVDFDAEMAKLEKTAEAKGAELARLDETMAAGSWSKVPDAVREQTTAKADALRVELDATREALAAFAALKAAQ
jgi:valyl-tRNA synthetase